MTYNNLSGYFKLRYGGGIKKICIDGGFSCPNRDGTCGYGGCIFCGERGAGEHIDASLSISEQVHSFFERNPKGNGFIAYFQNFTNTYAPIDELKRRYDSALIDDRIIALSVGTRPDCISDEVCKLLLSYTPRYDVWVELGFQTANDKTAAIINRGYTRDVFEKAVKMLNSYNIPVVVHLIVGLPYEDINDIKETVEFINKFPLWGIKIHSIYIMKNTALERMYLSGLYSPPTMKEYVGSVVYILTHISPEIIIHRLTGDCPKDMLVAPDWNPRKNDVINSINEEMQIHGYQQGCFFSDAAIDAE